MPAYVITRIEVHDPAAFQAYIDASTATIRKFGGHHIARGATADVLEGDANRLRNGIIQFATAADARAWYESADYQAVKKLRDGCATAHFYVLPGA
ncbi:MAG: DUF1330 domain-containing protein [Hyphomicrobiaceae bacterium]